MKTPLLPDEEPVRNGAANLQRGLETVGGWLYLTDQRLIFEGHAFNIQSGKTIIPLARITHMRKCWTKFLNIIPIFPNSIAIETTEGQEYCLVVFDRESWLDALEEVLE